MNIFLKIALASLIVAFVLKKVLLMLAESRDPLDKLVGKITTGMYITAILYTISFLITVVCGILTVIFWGR